MKVKNQIQKYNVTIILGFIVIAEIFDELVSTFFNLKRPSAFIIDIFVLVLSTTLVYLMLKGINKTSSELQRNRRRLKNIFDTLDVAIWSHDQTNNLLISPGIEKLYGYSMSDFSQDHLLWKKVIHPDDLPVLTEREKVLAEGKAVTSIYRIIRPDGEVRWIQDRGIPLLDEKGTLIDFNSVLFDITDKRESEERYRSIVEMSPDIIAVYSRGKIDYINEAGCRLFGAADQEELLGKPISYLIPPDILEEIKSRELTIEDNFEDKMQFEFNMVRPDGKGVEVEMTAMPILFEGRVARQIVGRDISERKKAEKTIEYMAYYDVLTGLPNRNMFRKHLTDALNRGEGTKLAVLFLDLDRFKIINDTKGHTIGDLILQIVAKRLKNAVRQDGIVSRQGGDEFLILVENADRQDVLKVAERILAEFSFPLDIEDQEFFVTPSIGISLFPGDGNDEEALIKNADTAMYLAKDRGKNTYQFYTSLLHGVSSHKMEMEHGIRKALERNQFVLFYQPQIELETGDIIGMEALVRWEHPKQGFISPGQFIPLAEETGLIVPLGKWVLKKACEQMKEWHEKGISKIPVAVNISVRQFQEDDFVDSVTRILFETGLDPHYLELEITESIMQNIERSTVILDQLKKIGVKISIDDFGTGYSSLSYLKHLPIDSIKIDKSFVDDIIQHSNQGAMVKTIIDMGLNLQFLVIAEGIETEKQVLFLKANGCRIGQGYFYSKPLPPDQVEGKFTPAVSSK
ncbi:putative bifunctional diguanylate cyclase/phosphodiesterase [Neobacillus terrae]|uniref:putative bifunctional diguanylate cyclase/phosphodiesterase n=1 Tax=Neobacillus terrae TaxID=3034837 RepID=UPI00140A6809|nr:EAL domain-containing protein [Neobacillus terrae]NHM31656.1 EAL domain-containing protein [Neobacillus terrae]